jgi:hypothetical protein
MLHLGQIEIEVPPNNACSGQVDTHIYHGFGISRFDGDSQPSHLPLTRAVRR